MKQNGKLSPLKMSPRRVAGQSVQEELERQRESWLENATVAILALVFLAQEIWRWAMRTPPSPIGAAIVCVPLFSFCVYRMTRLRPMIRKLKLGCDGEKIVGEKIESLRAHGYRVFHDLVAGEFNLDHVLVGPAGVFVIETKTWSKSKGEKIETDGEDIWRGGIKLEKNPIDQAKAEARWLHRLVKELAGESVFVQSVVLFPGWWVENKAREPKTLVLNPDQLEASLKLLPRRMDEKNIGFISNRLEMFARSN